MKLAFGFKLMIFVAIPMTFVLKRMILVPSFMTTIPIQSLTLRSPNLVMNDPMTLRPARVGGFGESNIGNFHETAPNVPSLTARMNSLGISVVTQQDGHPHRPAGRSKPTEDEITAAPLTSKNDGKSHHTGKPRRNRAEPRPLFERWDFDRNGNPPPPGQTFLPPMGYRFDADGRLEKRGQQVPGTDRNREVNNPIAITSQNNPAPSTSHRRYTHQPSVIPRLDENEPGMENIVVDTTRFANPLQMQTSHQPQVTNDGGSHRIVTTAQCHPPPPGFIENGRGNNNEPTNPTISHGPVDPKLVSKDQSPVLHYDARGRPKKSDAAENTRNQRKSNFQASKRSDTLERAATTIPATSNGVRHQQPTRRVDTPAPTAHEPGLSSRHRRTTRTGKGPRDPPVVSNVRETVVDLSTGPEFSQLDQAHKALRTGKDGWQEPDCFFRNCRRPSTRPTSPPRKTG